MHQKCSFPLLTRPNVNAQALMGKARVLEVQGQVQAAADLAGELTVR